MSDFIVKDSGKRKEFTSGMVRDTDADKICWSLITRGPLLQRWAEHLTAGAKKYGKDNWTLATGRDELKRFRESAFRHFMQWWQGDTDEDHAAAVVFNINGALYCEGRLKEQNENSTSN